MKVKARWGRIGRNPFDIHADKDAIATKTVEFPDGTPMEEIEKLAREDVPPKGYEFIDVKELK
jgi:hypothetical protein